MESIWDVAMDLCLPPMGDAFVSVDEFQDWVIYLSFKFDVQGFQYC